MKNKCEKCGAKLSPFYLKQTCPNCHVNLLYYKMEENLQNDAKSAKEEVDGLWKFVKKIDKAKLVVKYCNKKNKPCPYDDIGE